MEFDESFTPLGAGKESHVVDGIREPLYDWAAQLPFDLEPTPLPTQSYRVTPLPTPEAGDQDVNPTMEDVEQLPSSAADQLSQGAPGQQDSAASNSRSGDTIVNITPAQVQPFSALVPHSEDVGQQPRERQPSFRTGFRQSKLNKSQSLEGTGRASKARSLEGHQQAMAPDAPAAVSSEWLEQSVRSSVQRPVQGLMPGTDSPRSKASDSDEGQAKPASKKRGLLERSVSLRAVGQGLKDLVSPDKRTVKVMKERHWKREPTSPGRTDFASSPLPLAADIDSPLTPTSDVDAFDVDGLGARRVGDRTTWGVRARVRPSLSFESPPEPESANESARELDGENSRTRPQKSRTLVRRLSEMLSTHSSEGQLPLPSRRPSVMMSFRNMRQLTRTRFSTGRRMSVADDKKTYVFMEQEQSFADAEDAPGKPLLSRLMRVLGLDCPMTLATLFLLISALQIVVVLVATASFGIASISQDTEFIHKHSGDAVLYVKTMLQNELMQASVSQIHTALSRLPKCAEQTVEAVRTGKLDWDDDEAMERHLYSQALHWDVVYAFIGKRSGEAIMQYRGDVAHPSDRPFLALYTNGYNEPPTRIGNISDGSLIELMVDEEGRAVNLSNYVNSVPGYRSRLRPWYNVTRHAQVVTWIGPYLWVPQLVLGIDICIPIYDETSPLPKIDAEFDRNPTPPWEPAQESLMGVGCCDTTLDELSQLLAEQNLGKSGRAFVVEFGGEADGFLIAAARTGSVLQISTEIMGSVDDVNDGSDTSQIRYERLRAVDSEDPVIALVSEFLTTKSGRSWSEIGAKSVSMVATAWIEAGLDEDEASEIVISSEVLTGEVSNFGVNVDGTWSKENYQTEGIRWLLVIAIQARDYTQEIDRSREDAEEATAEHMRNEGLLTIAISLAAVLTAVAASSTISRPLNLLSHKMMLLRNLQYADTFAATAWIREIRALQDYMLRLRENVRVFDKFVPHTIVERMKTEREQGTQTSGTLWSEQRVCTVMQSTVKGFSAVSEVVSLETMLELLEDYTTTCTRIIEASGGVLVDSHGDEVLAFWTDKQPDHAAKACEAVLEQIQQLEALFARWRLSYSSQVHLIPMFGLHTAEGMVGNFGTAKRLKYGVVGEVVEVASLVNAMNRVTHTTFLISEGTWEAVHGRYLRKYVGTVPVKSGTQSNNVYVVLGRTSWNPQLNLTDAARDTPEFVEVVVEEEKDLNKHQMYRFSAAFLCLLALTAFSLFMVVQFDGVMKSVSIIFLVIAGLFVVWALVHGGASKLFTSGARTGSTTISRTKTSRSMSDPPEEDTTDRASHVSHAHGKSHTEMAATLQRPYQEGDVEAAKYDPELIRASGNPSASGRHVDGASSPLVSRRLTARMHAPAMHADEQLMGEHAFVARLGSAWNKEFTFGNTAVRKLTGWGRRLKKVSSSKITAPRRTSSAASFQSSSMGTDITSSEEHADEDASALMPSVWSVVMLVGLVVVFVAMGLSTMVHLPRYVSTMELVRDVSENATRSMSAKFVIELHRKVFWHLFTSLNQLTVCAHETRVHFLDDQLDLDDLPRLERHFFGQVLRYKFTWAYMGVAGSRSGYLGASRVDFKDGMNHPDVDLTTSFYNSPPNNVSHFTDSTTLIFDYGNDGYPRMMTHRPAIVGYKLEVRPWFAQTVAAGTALLVQPYLWVGEPYHLQLGVDSCAPWTGGNATLVSCCAMSLFEVSAMLSNQALGDTGVAFVVESRGNVPGALLAAAHAGDVIPVTVDSNRIQATESDAKLIAAVSRYLLSQHGTWADVPDGHQLVSNLQPSLRRSASSGWSNCFGWCRRSEYDYLEEFADAENVVEEWGGGDLQVVVQEYDGQLPSLRVDQAGRWAPEAYRAAGLELKLVIAQTDVDAQALSGLYDESRQHQSTHGTYYLIICVVVALVCAFLSHVAAMEVSWPMQQLQVALARVTELDFERTAEAETFVKDLQRIQEGFNTMRACLCTFDKFVPSSVISRVMSKSAAARAMAGCPWMRATECTVVHSRIWGFNKVTESVPLEEALEMMERYMRVCSDIIGSSRGVVSDFMGVHIVSFWQEEDARGATATYRELACEAVLRQTEAVQNLFSMWRRAGVRGSSELHFVAGMYTGRTYVGNFGTPQRLKYGVASETAAVAARLCNLTEIYRSSTHRPSILASGSTLSDDALIDDGLPADEAPAPAPAPPKPVAKHYGSLGAPPAADTMERAKRFKEGGGWFGASTKFFRGSQTSMPTVKPALVQAGKQYRWRKVDVINQVSREMGKHADGTLRMAVYELLGSQPKDSEAAGSATPTLDSTINGGDAPTNRPSNSTAATAEIHLSTHHFGPPRVTGDLGTVSDGRWLGAGSTPSVIHLPADSSSSDALSTPARRTSLMLGGLTGRSSGKGREAGMGEGVSIGLGSIDWSKA